MMALKSMRHQREYHTSFTSLYYFFLKSFRGFTATCILIKNRQPTRHQLQHEFQATLINIKNFKAQLTSYFRIFFSVKPRYVCYCLNLFLLCEYFASLCVCVCRILVHLSRGGAEVQMFAPDVSQMHVIDHGKGQPVENESRNVLSESARIARGSITDLAKLNVSNHDAVIFPGGFGAAKNLSTFAIDGKDCKVNKEVERVLKDFHDAGKPIGLCCISPVLAAKVLPGVDVTVGHEEEEGGKWPYAGTTQAITALGAKHTVKEVTEAHVDKKNKVVTTPAFMCETKLHLIFDGIGAMVRDVLKLSGK
uniref:Glutamine amidotransferase like class 1 domain containing 3A n=1 Tax=Cyprinus carpio TaxID=7962 RepID=A0A8C2GZ40_CYPCA